MPQYHVSRTAIIDASPDQVFETIADYGTWTTWSPWLIADPQATVMVSEDPCSEGSIYAWEGDVTGKGQLTHLQLIRGQRIVDRLEFLKPFQSVCTTSFSLEPAEGGTQVTWTIEGSLPWFLFWLIPTMKTLIGMDYQRGLNMLKDLLETGGIPSKTVSLGVQPMEAIRMAGISGSCHVDEIAPAMEAAFATAEQEFRRSGLSVDGPMISVYTRFQVKSAMFHFICGFVLPDGAQDLYAPQFPLKTWAAPAGRAFQVQHTGSYRHLGNGWSVANQLVRAQKLKQSKVGTFEIYRTIPPHTPENELLTDIYLPLK